MKDHVRRGNGRKVGGGKKWKERTGGWWVAGWMKDHVRRGNGRKVEGGKDI